MDNSFSNAVIGIESFNTGEPLIISRSGFNEDGYYYSVIAYVRTIADQTLRYIDAVNMQLFLPFTYPVEPPCIKVLSNDFFHLNFSADGLWTDSCCYRDESINDYLYRLILSLQYKIINNTVLGNRNAVGWYNSQKEKNIFPTDKINYKQQKLIQILNRTDIK